MEAHRSRPDAEGDARLRAETVPLPSVNDGSGRSLGGEELEELRQVIESGVLFGPRGTKVAEFEAGLRDVFGVPHARAVSSGTAAVHTALAAVDVGPGDEVITTPVTDMGGIFPILFQGAVPVFADVDPGTLNVTATTLRRRITERTRAILVTHLFGNPCDMAPILKLAAERGIPVVEDASQAHLATYRGTPVGTLGDVGAFSLQQSKHMTCGEGGFVLTRSEQIARRARLFADKGWAYEDPEPDHVLPGLNYRMTELQGAVAGAQLRKLEAMVRQRVRSAELLREAVRHLPGIRPVPVHPDAKATYWRFPLLMDASVLGAGPDVIGARLRELGVPNAPRYIRKPAFLCPALRNGGPSPTAAGSSPGGRSGAPEPRLEEYPGCERGLARLLVLPWTERHGPRHAGFVAGRLRRVVEEVGGGRVWWHTPATGTLP